MQIDLRPAYSIPAFCAAFGIERSSVFEEIARGRLRATKIGRRTLIAGTDALAWLESYRTAARPRNDRSAG